jgi:hypothetical protein
MIAVFINPIHQSRVKKKYNTILPHTFSLRGVISESRQSVFQKEERRELVVVVVVVVVLFNVGGPRGGTTRARTNEVAWTRQRNHVNKSWVGDLVCGLPPLPSSKSLSFLKALLLLLLLLF